MVGDQPRPKTNKKKELAWARRFIPVIPTTREMEVEELWSEAGPRKKV
jgi:hypothetical protein